MSEAILNRLRNGLVRTTKQTSEIICLKAELTSSTDELLSTSDDARMFSDANRVDRELMAYLINRKMINWCDKTCRLAPMRNDQASSVSGLLRAVVGSIWGVQDESIESFLRRLLHVAMTTGKQQSTFKERWRQEEETSHSEAQQSHSKDAWEDVYSAFQGNDDSQMEEKENIRLDPIHIFSLSNILRRPILILGDDSSTNSRSSSSSTSTSTSSITDLTGIYLPLLSNAESCVPYPLVLVRHEGLFRPLLVNRISLEWWQVQTFRSVPLVRVDQEPFHIRCLLTSESRRVRDLLMSYLNIAEISYTTPSGTIQVLTCRLSTKKPLVEGSESEDDVFANAGPIRMKPFSESCLVTDEEPSDEDVADVGLVLNGVTSGLEGHGCVRNCIACQMIRRDDQKKKLTKFNSRSQSESGSRSVRGKYSTRCENVQCKKEGSQKYGGRCYACYVVKDPWLEISSGDEKIRDLRIMSRNEDLVYPRMKELTVADPVEDRKIVKDTDDAIRQKDRIVETEFKDTKKLIKVDHTQEPTTFKHRRGSESIKDKSARAKDKHESKTVTGNGNSEDTLPVSTTDSTDAHDSAKVSDIAQIDECKKSEKPAKATGANESVVVSKTHDSISDPQPTSEHLMTSHPSPDMAGGPEERKSEADHKKCIVDFCNNRGETSYNGLCKTCYQTLARHRKPRDQEEENVLPPIPSSTVSGVQCLMDGCEGIVTNQQLGLCLSCLRMQIFAARDLERKKEQRRSFLLKLSENQVRTTKADASALVLPGERSSRSNKQKSPKSPRDVHATKVLSPQTQQRNGPALRNYSSSRTRAKCCLTADCDRYGDPGFDGYCSLCYERLSPGLLVPRS